MESPFATRASWAAGMLRRFKAAAGRLSVQARLIAVISALLLAVSIAVLTFFARRMAVQSHETLVSRARSTAKLLAHSVAPSLGSLKHDGAAETLRGLAAIPDAAYAVLRDENGGMVALWAGSIPLQDAPARVTRPGGGPVEKDGLLIVEEPVLTQVDRGGTLTMAFTMARFRSENRWNLLLAGLVTLCVFAVGLGMSILVGRLLGRPMRKLTEVAVQIARADLKSAEAALGGAEEVERLRGQFQDAGRNEMRQLTSAFAEMLLSLRETSLTLQESAAMLGRSIGDLTASASAQSQTVSRQAVALRLAQVNAGEFKQAAEQAAQQASAMLEVVDRAEDLGLSGQKSIEQTLGALAEIRERVEQIASRIGEQGTSTLQIVGITETVRDLASQSHLLALNAAIEAARVGEFGSGFAVVAQEMRGLADRSIEGTKQVESLLGQVTRATRGMLTITEEGVSRIQSSLAEVRGSGEKLRALSGIVGENAEAAREIAAAVNQQTRSGARLFAAVTELSAMMDDTLLRIESTNLAVGVVQDVSTRVQALAERYRT